MEHNFALSQVQNVEIFTKFPLHFNVLLSVNAKCKDFSAKSVGSLSFQILTLSFSNSYGNTQNWNKVNVWATKPAPRAQIQATVAIRFWLWLGLWQNVAYGRCSMNLGPLAQLLVHIAPVNSTEWVDCFRHLQTQKMLFLPWDISIWKKCLFLGFWCM